MCTVTHSTKNWGESTQKKFPVSITYKYPVINILMGDREWPKSQWTKTKKLKKNLSKLQLLPLKIYKKLKYNNKLYTYRTNFFYLFVPWAMGCVT